MQDATLDWQDGQPYSRQFGDVYFSRTSGIEETRHVFLHHNHLQERWHDLPDGRVFTIGETGFGTGLNFLCAWQLWRETASPATRLHYVSTEKYPLTRQELSQALSLWPELAEFSLTLLSQYRTLTPGWHRFTFDHGKVMLTLLVGDARETLPELSAKVDAWFLDGFAPAKNPEMWQPELFHEIARLSASQATFATFTSAGLVKRGLAEVGFTVEKVAGFGSKRDMLRGRLHAAAISSGNMPGNAIVIGGGISGTASAYSLAQRGWQVTLIERHAKLASEASGNPQGMLYARLTKHDIPLSRLALTGYLYTLNLLHRLLQHGADWDDCGLIQQAFDARETQRQYDVLQRGFPAELVHELSQQEASNLAGFDLPHGGLHFPGGGWVTPPALCQALASHANIMLLATQEAVSLTRENQQWRVHDGEQMLTEAAVVILATANATLAFPQAAHLPLQSVRGQITQLPATTNSRKLAKVLCTDGYVTPARNQTHCLGATFTPEISEPHMRVEDHQHNLHTLHGLSPALFTALDAGQLDVQALDGRAALRCASPDYLPMAGPLLDAAQTEAAYATGALRGHRAIAAQLPWLDGLYVNTAHGSKGLVSAPLCAELLASMINHEPLPMDASLARALDPNRFLLRQHGLKRLVGAAIG